MFVIVPVQRCVKCYDSLYEANVFHYESLNLIIKFIKDYQLSNKITVNNWMC
jgi:hypothetical protein